MLGQPVPEGLHPVGGTHTGAVREELQPVRRTHAGEDSLLGGRRERNRSEAEPWKKGACLDPRAFHISSPLSS